MDELKDKYYELDEIVSSLQLLIDSITYKEYIDELKFIKSKAEKEKDELEPRISAYEKAENYELKIEYERCRF